MGGVRWVAEGSFHVVATTYSTSLVVTVTHITSFLSLHQHNLSYHQEQRQRTRDARMTQYEPYETARFARGKVALPLQRKATGRYRGGDALLQIKKHQETAPMARDIVPRL